MKVTSPRSGTVVDAKMSLAMWLRAGRAQRGLTLEDVARITKIQQRTLERLESGKLDGLPADVFVRGFVRSFARCVGLDEAEALVRYSAAQGQSTAPTATAAARALVESMSDLAPSTATRTPKVLRHDPMSTELDVDGMAELAAGSLQDLPQSATREPAAAVIEPVVETVVEGFLPETGTLPVAVIAEPVVAEPVVAQPTVAEPTSAEPVLESSAEPIPGPVSEIAADAELAEAVAAAPEPTRSEASKKRGRRGGKRNKRKDMATGTPSSPAPVVVAATPVESNELASDVLHPVSDLEVTTEPTLEVTTEPTFEATEATTESTETWSPKMPTVVAATPPWRRPPSFAASMPAPVVPTLVIDDADPDSAERELEDRVAAKEPARRSFLPPILLDREDRSARQGGLTLAVIILLIAATLTLSYLMRRPSSSGDGVTQAEAAHEILS